MQELLNERANKTSAKIYGVVIGVLVGFSPDQKPLVIYADNLSEKPVIADATVQLTDELLGKKVALLFTNGDPEHPIIIGPIHEQHILKSDVSDKLVDKPLVVVLDGERIVLNAVNELTLKCGEASLTLKKNGKILLSGTNLLTRAKFSNRIKGGSVQIN